MFFQQTKNSRQRLFSMFFLDATIGNDDRRQCFAQDKMVRRAKKWLKVTKKSELLLFVKTLVQPSFSDVFSGFNHC